MATLVLKAHTAYYKKELKSIDQNMEEIGKRITHARELGDLKEMPNIMLLEKK